MSRPIAPSPSDEVPEVARGALWALAASVVCTFLLAFPALSGQFLLNPYSDQFKAGYAFRHFAAESLRSGHGIPLWNPYLFGGMPYVAAMHGDVFYPTALLRMLLPTDVAMTWGFIIHMVCAGSFTYLFLRAIGLSFASAMVGGIAYLLGGTVASYASPGHDGKLFVSALLPLALFAVHRGVFDGRRWAWGLLALVVGLQVLSPHPQLLQYSLLTTGAYAVFVAWRATRRRADGGVDSAAASGNPWLRLFASLGAVALGMTIGFVQFWPVREYVPWSPRDGGKGWDHAISYSLPIEELVNTWLPQFSGILDQYWGRNGIHLHSEYLGASVLLLAAFGMASGRAIPALRATRWFFIGTLVIATLWALGGNTPFYSIVYAIVPGTKFFRAPSTMLYVMGFATATLAAFGTERIVRGELSRRALLIGGAFSLIVLLVAVTGGFTNMALSIAGGLDPRLAARVEPNADAVVLGGVRSTVFALALCAVALVAVTRRWSQPLIAVVLGLVVAADLWSIARLYWRFDKPAAELFASDPVIDYLKKLPAPARTLSVQLGENAAAHDPYLGDMDGLMTHGIRLSLLGYHGNELGRFQKLAQKDEGYVAIGNPNFWALTNTRYLYTNTPTAPIEGAKIVAGPARNAAGTMVYLYELPGQSHDAWVTPLSVKAPDAQVLATVQDPRFDVRQAALFAPDADVPVGATPSTPPPPLDLPVTTVRPSPSAIDITLATPAPGGSALVVSENFYPGWVATIDGKPATVHRADYVLMGLALPAGARRVELRFESPTYVTGKRVTQAAVGAALLLLAWGLVSGRRAPEPHPLARGAAAQTQEAAA
ncbi:MAG: hypothetical protein MUF00_10930 [Gemmatimonadaceae bacterium]|jgi:hypothetical protein|nr:hypothetical protein [Gemmatimonadaceae bacterium]